MISVVSGCLIHHRTMYSIFKSFATTSTARGFGPNKYNNGSRHVHVWMNSSLNKINVLTKSVSSKQSRQLGSLHEKENRLRNNFQYLYCSNGRRDVRFRHRKAEGFQTAAAALFCESHRVATLPKDPASLLLPLTGPMWLLELISLFAAVFHMAVGTGQQDRRLLDPQREETQAVVGRFERELSEQRRCAEKLQKRLDFTTNAQRETKTELCRTEKDLSSSQEARHGLQREVESLRKANADLAASQVATQDESGALRESLREMSQILEVAKGQVVEIAELKKESEVVKKDNQEKTHELRHLRQVLEDTESLLDTRSRELREAQAYMTKADNISHADVQRKVEKLNSSIFQLSAQIADSIVFDESRPHSAELEKSYENIASLLSPATAKLLFHTLHAEDYVWVQNGLQALLAKLSSRIVMAWDAKMIPAKNLLLSDIHRVLFNEG